MDALYVQQKQMLKETENGHMRRAEMKQGNTRIEDTFKKVLWLPTQKHGNMVGLMSFSKIKINNGNNDILWKWCKPIN